MCFLTALPTGRIQRSEDASKKNARMQRDYRLENVALDGRGARGQMILVEGGIPCCRRRWWIVVAAMLEVPAGDERDVESERGGGGGGSRCMVGARSTSTSWMNRP